MKNELHLSIILPATPKQIYMAWLDSKKHSAMTGDIARIDKKIKGEFNTWDGYISGTTISKETDKQIVQNWRTTDFSDSDPDSIVEILLDSVEKGSKLTLNHTNIPEGQTAQYKEGWKEFYFIPMKDYFKKKAKQAKARELNAKKKKKKF